MKKILIPAFFVCVILFAFPIYIFLSQNKSGPESTSQIAQSSSCTLPLQPKILQIEYYPRSSSNPAYLDAQETGLNMSIAQQQNYVANMSSELVSLIGTATKFHGYKNPNAPQFLKYSVIETKKYYQNIPRGYLLKQNEGVYRPHYAQIMNNENICDYVDNKGVTEVWMFGYHHGAIEPDESRMASSLGDFSNSWPKEHELPVQFRLPVCNKPYVLYNFNYTRAVMEMFHNRIHQLENILPRAERKYPPTPENTARGASLFWGNFSEYVQPYTVRNYNSSCGNAHYTPNWANLSQDYIYNIPNSRLNNCETWNPDSSKSTFVNASCSQWGCSEKGFYMWYQQNVPGYNSGITYGGDKINNWWEAMYDPVAYLEKGGLTGESIYNNCTIAGISPTPTPPNTPTPTKSTTPTPTIPIGGVSQTPSPTKTPTPVPTATPTPTNTPTPTLTQNPTSTQTPTPSLRATATLTAIPTNGTACDPDGSGGITLADLRLARRELAGLELNKKASCMTGGNGTSLADLRKIRRMIAGLE
ncbi:MAG: hypothetical protein KA035_02200 [Candidatus Levybacteria bacterium]|nr:hypothetical protein [Candidatus Levybacteria bacterium]